MYLLFGLQRIRYIFHEATDIQTTPIIIISFKDSTIVTYVKNENNYKGIITNKDSIIKEYKKAYLSQRIQKYIAYGVSSIILLVGILY
jgi:hypothetical protein